MVGNKSSDYIKAHNAEAMDYLLNHPEEINRLNAESKSDNNDTKEMLRNVLDSLGAINVKGGIK